MLLAGALFLLPGSEIGATDQASAASLIAPESTCPDLPASGGKAAMNRARNSMICMVNHAREKKGLSRYRTHSRLHWSAKRKARDILQCGFSHSACGRPFDFWIQKTGYLGEGGWATGENIAWGSGAIGGVRSIFIAWMKSKGHREAILDRSFKHVGAGVIEGRFSGLPGARIWVLHFGYN